MSSDEIKSSSRMSLWSIDTIVNEDILNTIGHVTFTEVLGGCDVRMSTPDETRFFRIEEHDCSFKGDLLLRRVEQYLRQNGLYLSEIKYSLKRNVRFLLWTRTLPTVVEGIMYKKK